MNDTFKIDSMIWTIVAGRLFSSGDTPTPEAKRSGQGPATGMYASNASMNDSSFDRLDFQFDSFWLVLSFRWEFIVLIFDLFFLFDLLFRFRFYFGFWSSHMLKSLLKCLRSVALLDGQPSKWSQCQFCKLVITTVNLWRHIRTQHTEQSPRQCEHCQKKFKNKYSLREHVRIAHEQKPGTATT